MLGMEKESFSSRLQVIQPILMKFLKEKKEIEENAKRDGKIPEDLCRLCSDSSRLAKITVNPLKEDELSQLSVFLKWIKRRKITLLNGLFYSGMGSIGVETREPIARMVPIMLDKGIYRYSFPLSDLQSLHSDLKEKYDGLQSCPHFDADNPKAVHLFREEDVPEKRSSFAANSVPKKRKGLFAIAELPSRVSYIQSTAI